LNQEEKAELAVDMYRDLCDIEESRQIVVNKINDKIVFFGHHKFIPKKYNRVFNSYRCFCHDQCDVMIYVPNFAPPGLRQAFRDYRIHTCNVSTGNYDQSDFSILGRQVFTAFTELINAGFNLEDGSKFDDESLLDECDEVKDAAKLYNKCVGINEKFNQKFTDEKDKRGSVYARFKVMLKEKGLPEAMLLFLAYIGQRISSRGDRLSTLVNVEQQWISMVKFCAGVDVQQIEYFLIPTCTIRSDISEFQAKVEEAGIQRLFVKPQDHEKMILNQKYDPFPAEYRFATSEHDLLNSAFILARGFLLTEDLRVDDVRPKQNSGNINNAEFNLRLRKIRGSDKAELEKMTAERDVAIFERDQDLSKAAQYEELLKRNGIALPEPNYDELALPVQNYDERST